MPQRTDRNQTFDRAGNLLDEQVVDVTVPDEPDYGEDAEDLEAKAADAVQALRSYLALGSPTGAQTVAALKLTIRVVLYLVRRSLT